MKMLEAGGVPPLADHRRAADLDNPNGYYEFEPVKRTKEDPSWLSEAEGRAVKMVYSLLYDLPSDRDYDVVFMRRELPEILASQRKMLDRKGHSSPVSDEKMAALFAAEIAKFASWLEMRKNMRSIEIHYGDVVRGDADAIDRLNDFLGGQLDASAMRGVVDPKLYRQRVA
jgi:hypothetical protein